MYGNQPSWGLPFANQPSWGLPFAINPALSPVRLGFKAFFFIYQKRPTWYGSDT